MSTDNLRFGAKIRKIGIPLQQFFYIKVWFKGVYITWTCFRDYIFGYVWILVFVSTKSVWPVPFLINMLTALKGPQFYHTIVALD